MKCPICNKDLGEAVCIDINSEGWHCNHDEYELRIVKMYKDKII